MSASSEIRFKIGADTSALSRGFAEAQSIAAAAGQQIHRKLGLKDAFKSGVLALGLSIEKISEKIAEMFTGGAQEAWKAALESANESARIIEESALRRMSTLRQIAKLENEIRRNAENESATPKKTGELSMPRKVLDAIGENLFEGLSKFFTAIGAKGGARGTAEAAALFRRRGAETGTSVESEAEAAARAAKATADRHAAEAKIEELKEKRARDEARVDAAFLEYARLSMTEFEKALSIQDELVKAEERLNDAKRKGKETTELELEVLSKKKSLELQLLKIEKDQAEEDKKKKRAREEYIEKYRRFLGAQERVGEARQGLKEAKHDALAFGLDESAEGKRGSPADRMKARRILKMEERARKLFDSGRKVTEFDPRTQRNVEIDAETLQNRAAQMRKSFGKLKTDEKNPFAAAEKQLEEANKHLAEVERLLTTTETE